MKSSYLNITGWLLEILGTLFLFIDSLRTSARLPKEGMMLGDPEKYKAWYYQFGSSIGFGCLLLGFVFCGVSMLINWRTKANPTEIPKQAIKKPIHEPTTE